MHMESQGEQKHQSHAKYEDCSMQQAAVRAKVNIETFHFDSIRERAQPKYFKKQHQEKEQINLNKSRVSSLATPKTLKVA